MDLFSHLNETDSALDFAHDLLAENSPPPLDPGADDEMDEVDELDDSLFDFIASTPADVHVFAHWGSKTEENNQSLKDNIAIVQDLPPAVESKSLFGGALNAEFNPLPSGNSPLPWEAFVQSHMQQFNSDKTTITASAQLPAAAPAPEEQLDLASLISSTPEDPLSSESYYSLSSLGLPAIKEEAVDEPLQPLSQNSQLESSSSSSSLTSFSEPVRTEEERKRRNRVYAKRSRDLKNQKYKEAMILNDNLQARLKEREQKHHELELQHQKVLRRVQELEHRLEIYEKGVL